MEYDGAGTRGQRAFDTRVLRTKRHRGVKTYYYRLKKLREAAVELTQPEIVQVEAPEILEQKSIVIQSGNASIEIPGNANPETVRAAVSFLKQP